MFELARRNGVSLPYADTEAVGAPTTSATCSRFWTSTTRACSVLVHERDFYELTTAYLARARAQGVRHVEIFFDPQTHTGRGVTLETVVGGIGRALTEARQHGISSHLIMCFLRDLPADDAMATLEEALAHTGTRSSASGSIQPRSVIPRQKFRDVFDAGEGRRASRRRPRRRGGAARVHRQALDVLGAERIDHGVRCLEDRASSSASRPIEPPDRLPVLERQAAGGRNARAAPSRRHARDGLFVTATPTIRPTSADTSARTSPESRWPSGSMTTRSCSSPATASTRRFWTTPPRARRPRRTRRGAGLRRLTASGPGSGRVASEMWDDWEGGERWLSACCCAVVT